MDSYFEQLLPIKKNASNWTLLILIWVAVLGLSALAFRFTGFGPVILAGLAFGGYKLSGKLSVEYEYIITNGSFDVDKITAKSDRKRVLSFEIKDIDNLEKFNPSKRLAGDTVIACNTNAEAYFLTAKNHAGKNISLVFAPNDKIKGAVKKYLPTYIANSAFK